MYRFLPSSWGRLFVITFLVLGTAFIGVFSYYYLHYSRVIEAELRAGPFSNATLLYGAPHPLAVGEETSGEEIAAYLRRGGYTESSTNRMGWYRLRPDAVEIN